MAALAGIKQRIQTNQFGQCQLDFAEYVCRRFDDMHPALGQTVQYGKFAAVRFIAAGMIDPKGLPGFHAIPCRGDDAIGAMDNMGRGTVVFDQIIGPGLIIAGELFNESDIGAAEA